MDTFFEQIVPIKKSGKSMAAFVGIIILAIILCLAAAYFFVIIGPIAILLAAGVLYGAYKLISLFNTEYEYIITNGTFDIDKIINKSSRKRIASFQLSDVSVLEKYDSNTHVTEGKKTVLYVCNVDDPNAYIMTVSSEGEGTSYIIMSPDDRLKGAMVKFMPKFVSNSAFK